MARKGRLTLQVQNAIVLLKEEGSIVIPMTDAQYEASKDYKFCIVEQIHEVQKNKMNWQVQMRLFEEVRDELLRQNKEISTSPEEGIIRLK